MEDSSTAGVKVERLGRSPSRKLPTKHQPSGVASFKKGAAGVGVGRAREYEKGLIQLLTREYTGQQIKRQTLAPGFFADGLIFLPSQAGITEIAIPTYSPSMRKSILLRVGIK